ncbi:MAG: multicopper oxidase family protein [Gemmatimonadaceae bacterium]|nr:multicopper oxidase family protein [Gemmatimonadaceae bacterium]
MHRRTFLEVVGGAGALSLTRPMSALLAPYDAWTPALERAPLILPPVLSGGDLTLTATAHTINVAPGVKADVWSVGDGPLCPTIRMRTGDTTRIRFENMLPEPSILHRHGLLVPEAADGHPRLAVGTGGSYQYSFPVINRAGTYWYHAHPHHRTGVQIYRGMAGLLFVDDTKEDMLGFPPESRELPVIIQDKRLDAKGAFVFEPAMHEQMEGYFGDTPYVNGVRLPFMAVETTTYRLRVINASTSRILRLEFSNKMPMTLIGNDGGLLPEPATLTSIDLGTGERADLLVDFGKIPDGQRVMLQSAEFASPARMGGMGGMAGMGGGRGRMGAGGIPQGSALKLVEFEVTKEVTPEPWKPMALPAVPKLDPARAAKTRSFTFDSAMMQHTINGRPFEMDRVDETVKFGTYEIWNFVNNSPFAHPVHMHAVQFQVLKRVGGRARLFPWEQGWKDTVLVHPGETVSVMAAFDRNRGRFLLHCHNLVHEDMGMMMNFDIV